MSRSRSYSLVHRDSDTAAVASAAPAPSASVAPPPVPVAATAQAEAKPAVVKSCSSPGNPARLEVFPSRKLMKTGDAFAFRATVFDDAGCSVPAKPVWTVGPGGGASHASVDASGTVTVAADAPEGHFDLVASVGGKGVTIDIEIATPEHYDALLATSGLNEAGESEQAAIATIATGSIGSRAAIGEDGAKERKHLFLAIVGLAAACLGLAGLALVRRARRSGEAGGIAGANDGEDESGNAAAAVAIPPGPPIEPAAAASSRRAARGKICPTCGEHYDGGAEFCGKDGTTLVLVN